MGGAARTCLVALALVAATGGVYAGALSHPFLFDAVDLVLESPDIRSLGRLPGIAGLDPGAPGLNNRWVRDASYALEYAAAGAWAPLYHLDNVLLHAGAGLLVLVLVRRLSGRLWLAAGSAALFLLHPVNADVVAQVAGRRELLAAVFALLALLLLERWAARGARWALAGALVALYLATFSKELGLLAAPAFLLVDAYRGAPAAGAPRPPSALGAALRRLRERPGGYALLAATALLLGGSLLLLSSWESVGPSGSPSYYAAAGSAPSLLDRLRLCGLGLRLLLAPVGLSADYFYDSLGLAEPGLALLEAVDLAVLAGALCATIWGLARGHWLGFGGAWYALFYLPHAGLIPWHEVFAERFLYLASIGFAVAAVAGAGAVVRRLSLRPALAAACGLALLVALGAATERRVHAWESASSLWRSVLDRYPRNARAHKGLGQVALEARRYERALARFRAALGILPSYLDARLGSAAALLRLGRLDEASALLEPVLETWPEHPKALTLRGFLLDARGSPEAARQSYRRALESDPGFAPAYNNLARHSAIEGDLREAVRLYEKALEHDPAFVAALRNLAQVYRRGLGDFERAAAYERRARELARARGVRE